MQETNPFTIAQATVHPFDAIHSSSHTRADCAATSPTLVPGAGAPSFSLCVSRCCAAVVDPELSDRKRLIDSADE
jgi:hypothetical protein